ncbi:MAG: Hsp20 family protein [Candidatus Sumerlaeota bacterium]|nr:Hsp20 family protein [Candidatus Sumerlaeota bacterium]
MNSAVRDSGDSQEGNQTWMLRSIPSKTMKDLSRAQRGRRRSPSGAGQGIRLRIGGAGGSQRRRQPPFRETKFAVKAFEKPRDWRFQTKPLFKKIRGPLVDVFHEAEEVLIIIDLGGFRRGDVSLTMTAQRYVIDATRDGQRFQEEIRLPPEVDMENCVENFRNGVLEIILPKKRRKGTR